MKKLQQVILSQYMVQGGFLSIYLKNNFGEQEPILYVSHQRLIFSHFIARWSLWNHSVLSDTQAENILPQLTISYHICQLFKGSKKFDRPLMRRIYDINTPTLTDISMDIKHMPASKSPYKYILVLLCNTSNFLVATPMKKATAEEVCSTLFDNFMAYYAVLMRINVTKTQLSCQACVNGFSKPMAYSLLQSAQLIINLSRQNIALKVCVIS